VGSLVGFENGSRRTSPRIAAKIAEAIGLTLDRLLAPEEPAGPPALHLSNEALEIAELWTLANTDLRVAVRAELAAHLAARTDLPPNTLVTRLRASGIAAAAAETPAAVPGKEDPAAASPDAVFLRSKTAT